MAIVKHKNSPYWYYSFMYEGKTHFGSTKTTNKALAQKVEDQKRIDVISKTRLGLKDSISLREAMEAYVETRSEKKDYNHIKGRASIILGKKHTRAIGNQKIVEKCYGLDGTMNLHNLQEQDIQRLISQRRKEKLSDTTILFDLGILNRAVKLAKRCGYLIPDISFAELKKENGVKPAKGRTRFLSNEEEIKLLNELDPNQTSVRGHPVSKDSYRWKRSQDLYDLVVLLLDTGARHTEISEIRWSDINMETGVIQLWREKVQNESVLTMTDRTRKVLERRKQDGGEGQIFVFENAAKTGPRRYGNSSLRNACKRAGIKGVTFHTLRHTFCSTLVINGTPLYEIQQLVGHTTPTMTARYAHLAPNVASTRASTLLNKLHQKTSVVNNDENNFVM